MYEQIYYKYFNEKILPVIGKMEKERVSTVCKVVICAIFFVAIGFALAGLFIYSIFNKLIPPLLLPVILFATYCFILKGITSVIVAGKEYQNKLVKDVLPLFLEPVANFKNWPANRDTETIIDAGILHNFESREDAASYFGIHKGVNITVSNTSLTAPVNRTLFKGTLIQIELPFNIQNHIIMLSKNEGVYTRYRQINLHNRDMNEYVYVFARNTNDLDYISEKFWEAVKKLGTAYIAKGLALSFRGNTILIALRQKKPMQFGFLFRTLLKPENYDDLIARFTAIFELIDSCFIE